MCFAPQLVEMILLMGVIAVGWHFFLDSADEHVRELNEQRPGQTAKPVVKLDRLLAVPLFGVRESKPLVRSRQVPLPVSRLQLKLRGTILAGVDSVALIQPAPDAEEGVYVLGGQILPGIHLLGIESDHIVIDEHGTRVRVMMDKAQGRGMPAQPLSGAAASSAAPASTAPSVHAQHSTPPPPVSGPFVNAGTAPSSVPPTAGQINFLSMIALAGLSPSVQDGQVEGMKVNQVVRGSLFARLGLRRGDIIQSIDGRPVTSIQAARQAYAAARKTGYITLVIVRDGQTQSLYQAIE